MCGDIRDAACVCVFVELSGTRPVCACGDIGDAAIRVCMLEGGRGGDCVCVCMCEGERQCVGVREGGRVWV